MSAKLKVILERYKKILKKLIVENKGYIVLAQLKEKLEKATEESFTIFEEFNITKLKQFILLIEEGGCFLKLCNKSDFKILKSKNNTEYLVLKKTNTSQNKSKILKDLESFDGSVFHSDLETSFKVNSIKKKKKKRKKKRKKVDQQISLNTCSKKNRMDLFSSVNEKTHGNLLPSSRNQYSPWNKMIQNKLVGKK